MDKIALRAAATKYQRLAVEIETGASRGDMQHSVSKLGIFLEQAVGSAAWREAMAKDEPSCELPHCCPPPCGAP